MKSIIKISIILIALLCTGPLVFADHYLGWGTGMNFYKDHFTKENYTRFQIGSNFIFAYYFFPENFPLGVHSRISLGGATAYREANARESMLARRAQDSDFRFIVSPSFKLQAGSKCFFPFSLGPALIINTEKITERAYEINVGYSGATIKEYDYKAISGGLNGDFAFVVAPAKHFFIRPGMSFDYVFLRAEKGEMRMNYRTTNNTSFKGTPYSAFNTFFYFTLGTCF